MTTQCIACEATPAYIPFFGDCECSNSKCRFYSPLLFPDVKGEAQAEMSVPMPVKNAVEASLASTSDEQKPQYFWSTRHNDFGDI